jgi:hypothetical protein
MATALLVTVLAACDTNRPAPSGYSCGTPQSGHCYAVTDNGLGWQPIGVTLRMNTLNAASSSRGDLFFTNETWLTSGFNEWVAWVEAGQLYDLLGLQYFWAELFVPQDQKADGIFFHTVRLGDITPTDASSGTVVTIRRTTPNTFGVRILAAGSSFAASTTNFIWAQRDYGGIELGMELAGTSGAHVPVVSYQPSWIADAAPVTRPWTIPATGTSSGTSSGTSTGAPAVSTDPPTNGGWIQPPSDPQGGIWYTSCCVPPAAQSLPRSGQGRTALQPLSLDAGRLLVRAWAAPPAGVPRTAGLPRTAGVLRTAGEVVVPSDHPTIPATGALPIGAGADLLQHPDQLVAAVDAGLLTKVGPTGTTTLTAQRCADPSAGADGIPAAAFDPLPTGRPLCWFVFGGGFRVTGPRHSDGTRPVPSFASAFLISDPATGAVLSSGAYAPSP